MCWGKSLDVRTKEVVKVEHCIRKKVTATVVRNITCGRLQGALHGAGTGNEVIR